jgi:hypothetical protein
MILLIFFVQFLALVFGYFFLFKSLSLKAETACIAQTVELELPPKPDSDGKSAEWTISICSFDQLKYFNISL